MANFAVIKENVVTNIIVAESKEVAENVTGLSCIDYTEGWDYENGIDGGDFFPVLILEEVILEEETE
jgi:hypothetical protein